MRGRASANMAPNQGEKWGYCTVEPKETAMAMWKRLTDSHGGTIDVNLDQACFMEPTSGGTDIHFITGGKQFAKETPDEIHGKAAIGEFGV
jgi:hypothetical protein